MPFRLLEGGGEESVCGWLKDRFGLSWQVVPTAAYELFSDPNPGSEPDRGIVGGFLHWLGEGIGVARPEHDDFIKRVVAVEGDTWEIADGGVFVNGSSVEEPYLATELDTRDFGPEVVPDGMLFVLGDNRAHSGDSRFPPPAGLGYVPEEDVIGEAFVIAWPLDRIGGVG